MIGSDGYFAGSVDEVAVYPSVLTAAQVAANYGVGTTNGAAYAAQVLALHPGLYLRLDDTPPNPAALNLGSLGAAANGRYLAGAQPSATTLISPAFPGLGTANPGLVFDGTGKAMAIGYANIPVPWTMSCWAVPLSTMLGSGVGGPAVVAIAVGLGVVTGVGSADAPGGAEPVGAVAPCPA